MKYKKIYKNLVSNKKNRKKMKGVYYEAHHIIPKCMGGSNSKENIVLLTHKEHYIAHLLLTKIYPKNTSLKYSIFRMTHSSKWHDGGRKLNSRQLAKAKELMVEAARQRRGEKNSFYGKKHTKEFCESQRIKGRKRVGEKNSNYGNKWNDEQKKKISLLNKGRLSGEKNPAKREEVRKKIREGKMGEKNPNAHNWKVLDKLSGEVLFFTGGIKRFFKNFGNEYSFFKAKTGSCKRFEIIEQTVKC